MLVFIIPMLVVAFCYIRIAAVVWKIPDFVPSSNDRSRDVAETFILRRHRSRQSKRCHVERNKMKAVHLTICILACYILCWLPYFTINLLNVWTDYKFKHNVPSFLKSLAKCLAWFSSCVNPIIYGTFHRSSCPLPSCLLPNCCKKESSLSCDSAMTCLQPSLRVRRHAICSDPRRVHAAGPIPLSTLASSVTSTYTSLRGSAYGPKKTDQALSPRRTHHTSDDCGGTWL
ncbi:hypothetical protein RvY_14954 [Ramazzottius varieornatus]|uniref:G-protein coupled receptors family 1 profile domain-containing protein n=1 Tax=Ramazzottius varieornatus TaxID=947166 RepID=A0A1D1W1G6_RAMVA|nr:hypothetical protein RvY_14954 [Ramazzottius varieornatus]